MAENLGKRIQITISVYSYATGFLAMMALKFICVMCSVALIPILCIPMSYFSDFFALNADASRATFDFLHWGPVLSLAFLLLFSIPMGVALWGARAILADRTLKTAIFFVLWAGWNFAWFRLNLLSFDVNSVIPIICVLIIGAYKLKPRREQKLLRWEDGEF